MLAALASVSLLLPTALAFANTAPLVAWSSQDLPSLDNLASRVKEAGPVIDARAAFGLALEDKSICELGTVLLVDVEGLHASDLKRAAKLVSSATLNVPYLTFSASSSASPLSGTIDTLRSLCGDISVAEFTEVDFASVDTIPAASQGLRIVHARASEESLLKDGDSSLSALALDRFATTVDLLLLTGHPSTPAPLQTQQLRRASAETPLVAAYHEEGVPTTFSPSPFLKGNNNTQDNERDTRPLLAKYQFLTTPIIGALLVSFGVLMPILALGILALSGIQVPPRMDNVKGIIVTSDKKNQ